MSSSHFSLDMSVQESSDAGGNTEGSSLEISDSDTQVCSILHVLRPPTPSILARKRKVQCNHSLPPTGAKRCKGSTPGDPKNVKALGHVKQYPKDHYCVCR